MSSSTPRSQVNPQGAFIVWNYKERITADATSSPHKIDETIVITSELVSMATSKNKTNPAGRFEVRLAPTVNWVARLTPGSWCALLMSRSVFPEIKRNDIGTADRRLVKMLARINSVRLSVSVDQNSGARRTEYVVTGEDWGQIFNSKLYIDPVARNNNFDQLTTVGHAERILFEKLTIDMLDENANLPTSATVFDAIIKLWGAPLADLIPSLSATFSSSNLPTPALVAKAQYKLPEEVVRYFGFGPPTVSLPGAGSANFGDILVKKHGVLKSYDTYSGDNKDSHGFINPSSLFGINSFWQLLVDNSNPTLNECITDMRWEDDSPQLCVYRRIRPFLIRSNFDGSTDPEVDKNISLFKNVRRVFIRKKDVITINAGTDLKEKINFIEVKPNSAFMKESHEVRVKFESQEFDYKAYERDGFRPLIAKSWYLPFDGNAPAPIQATQWKSILREWHFVKDSMLNGAISFIGLNDYIQVGDNIMVDASVMGAPFNKSQADQNASNDPLGVTTVPTAPSSKPFLLAHVEQVENSFDVDPESGARTFITTVRFIRGVITDQNGQLLGEGDGGLFSIPSPFASFLGGGSNKAGAIDKQSSDMNRDDELHTNVNRRSLKSDPLTNDLKNNDDDGSGS